MKILATNRNDISRFRKEQNKKKNLRNLIVLLIVILVVFMIYLFKDTIFEPLEGIASRIGYNDKDAGFPIKTPGSVEYKISPMGDGFALLTDSYVISYAKDGRKIGEFQHGFFNPVMVSKNDRIIVFDKGSTGFKVYSKTKLIYEGEAEENIVYANLGNNRNTVLVTNASYYMNYVFVYDENGNKVYTYKSVNNVVGVEFSRDDKRIYLSDLGTESGDLQSNFSCFDLKNDTGAIWSSSAREVLTYDVVLGNHGIIVVDNQSVKLLSEAEGQILGSFNYSGKLIAFAEKDGSASLLVYDNISNSNKIIALDKEMKLINSKTVSDKATGVTYGNKIIAILCNDHITTFDLKLENENTSKLDDEYASLISANGNIVLQGLDYINKYSE